ncbi:MAG: redoxin domain-containing protein [Candidatus Marinimicrobia bacterium]|nr:redoxin domain-containing protein [Candidatus Neomarinimicrobiota bacterium]
MLQRAFNSLYNNLIEEAFMDSHRLFPAFLLTLLLSVSFHYSPASAENTTFQVQLESRFIDEIGYLVPEFMGYSTHPKLIPQETVKAIPGGYASADTIFWSFQHRQYVHSQYLHNPEIKAFIDKEFPDYPRGDMPIYSDLPIDGVLTFCLLEDSEGNEFLVFDSNNDEDLTDEEIHPVEGKDSNTTLTHYPDFSIAVNVDIEMFDGADITTVKLPLYMSRIKDSKVPYRFTMQIRKMPIGEIAIEGQNYKIGIIPAGEMEFDLFDDLWVDSNSNGFYDENDLSASMHKPFTLGTRVYQVSDIDRTGRNLVIRQTELAPLAEGIVAPDFTSLTVDSNEFTLSKLRGKVVLLDFWGTWCGPCRAEIPHLKSAYEQFGGDRFEIVSISVEDELPELKKFISEKTMPWTHIAINRDDPLTELYQVAKYPTTFLIAPDGTLLIQDSPSLRGKYLQETIAAEIGKVQ